MFTGDISVGGKIFSDAIASENDIPFAEAEELKRNAEDPEVMAKIADILDAKVDYVAGEINRQLSLFWNAAGIDEGIDALYVTGGGVLVPGLMKELETRTGVECQQLDPFKGVKVGAGFDASYVEKHDAFMSIAVGMAARQPGDKEFPDY